MDLIIDIGNGSVGVAIVNAQEAKPRIVHSLRELVLFEEKPSGDALQHAIIQALGRVLSEVLQTNMRQTFSRKIQYKKIVCILSSPWFVSHGKSISISQEKEFVMSPRFLQDILVKESTDFQEPGQAGSSYIETSRTIESMVIGGTVNGYKLSNLVGQKTREADISLYVSRAETTFVEAVTNMTRRHTTGNAEIIFHTFPFVVFSSLREIFPDSQDYIHMDVAGEITDIAVVAGNMIQKTISYPLGKNVIIRDIAEHFGVPGDAARSLFHMCMDRRADTRVIEEVQKSLARSEKQWNGWLDTVFTGDIQSHPHPKIFLTAYPQTAELFETFLTSWHSNLAITHIDQDLLAQFVSTTPGLELDIFLALEAFFLTRFL